MKIKENVKWFLKYNSLKLEKEEVEKAFQDEIKRLLIENQNLKASEKEYRNKLTMKNKRIRELKEILRGGK
jgi:Pyruvate/2-oxoacid:ferredoxin oxidoreductase gamma subunit